MASILGCVSLGSHSLGKPCCLQPYDMAPAAMWGSSEGCPADQSGLTPGGSIMRVPAPGIATKAAIELLTLRNGAISVLLPCYFWEKKFVFT